MKLILVAVGTRMPAWVDTAFDDFAKRMPRELPLQLVEVKAEPRTTGKTVDAMMALEAARIEAALPPRCRRLILDERGADLSTRALAKRLEHWQDGGDDIAIIIGGPDGLDPALKATAHETQGQRPVSRLRRGGANRACHAGIIGQGLDGKTGGVDDVE